MCKYCMDVCMWRIVMLKWLQFHCHKLNESAQQYTNNCWLLYAIEPLVLLSHVYILSKTLGANELQVSCIFFLSQNVLKLWIKDFVGTCQKYLNYFLIYKKIYLCFGFQALRLASGDFNCAKGFVFMRKFNYLHIPNIGVSNRPKAY